MTLSSLPNLDLARDANFSTLMGLARPPAIGTISGARLTNGQYNVEFDGSDGGETIAAWPVNAIEYRDGDVVWILFLSASSASGVILGRNSPAPVAMAVHSHTSELDSRYGRLAGSNAWAGANAFALAPSAPWWDQAMGDDADNDPFDGNASDTPAGWTQVVAPSSSTTASMRGFWRITGNGSVTSWKYRKPLAALRDTVWDSVQWGPVMFRDGRWGG